MAVTGRTTMTRLSASPFRKGATAALRFWWAIVSRGPLIADGRVGRRVRRLVAGGIRLDRHQRPAYRSCLDCIAKHSENKWRRARRHSR